MWVFDYVDSLKFTQQKDNITQQFKTIVEATRQFNQNTSTSLTTEENNLDKIKSLIANEANECSELFNSVYEAYKNALTDEKKYLERRMRAIEDLNDIQERFYVVVRQANIYHEASIAFTKATDNLAAQEQKMRQDCAKDPTRQEKWDEYIEKVKNTKKEALKTVIESLKKFIEEKKKFNTYRCRKMKESYATYGKAMNEYSKSLSEEYSKLHNDIDKVRLDITNAIVKHD